MTTRVVLVPLTLLLAAGTLGAWQWPLQEPSVVVEFGQVSEEVLMRGVRIGAAGQAVFPVSEGTVVAVSSEGPEVTTGLGTFVVIEHAGAFRSVYAHLDSDEALPVPGSRVTTDTQIGVVGSTGHTAVRALTLLLLDIERRAYVNPRLLLPDLPDQVRPRVISVILETNEGVQELGSDPQVAPGTYGIVVEVADQAEVGGPRLGPYEIDLFVDGQSVFGLRLDGVRVEDGKLRLMPGETELGDLFQPNGGMLIGEIALGNAPVELEILVRDFAGNELVWSRTIRPATDEESTGEDVQQET